MEVKSVTRAVVVAFHNYCYTMDHKYFDVMFEYFMDNFHKYWKDEVDRLYLIDSTWSIEDEDVDCISLETGYKEEDPKIQIIKVDASTRYYDAYKQILPKIQEDLVLFMDNDMVISQKGKVASAFESLEKDFDVVTIMDTIGTWTTDRLKLGNKFCPYFFATSKNLLMGFRYSHWEPKMPEYETLGDLTRDMVNAGVKVLEIEDDKNHPPINPDFYHIRAGSVPAYLLTTKHYGDANTYWEYIKNQPASETLRHCWWYDRMGGDTSEIRKDLSEKEAIVTN